MTKCCSKATLRRLELLFSILFGLWNNISTVLNAKTLGEKGHYVFSGLTVFFLLFPGLVTSAVFLAVHCRARREGGSQGEQERGDCRTNQQQQQQRLSTGKLVAGCLLLLVCYPLVPLFLGIASLVTGQGYRSASLARLFEGFLDDAAQFVIRLIVVVLYGIGLTHESDIEEFNFVFKFSMATTFLTLVIFGLKFNERDARKTVKILLCLPMLAAFAVARAFLLAVFLKETLGNTKEILGGLGVLVLFCCINIGSFKFCGQDLIRSIIFGLCSILIPAGYGNDPYYYQCPNQPLTRESWRRKRQPKAAAEAAGECMAAADDDADVEEGDDKWGYGRFLLLVSGLRNNVTDRARRQGANSPDSNAPSAVGVASTSYLTGRAEIPPIEFTKMRSGLFLILYTISNALLLGSCAIYVSATRDLTSDSANALALPLILAVVPGCFFALSRAILLEDMKPRCLHQKVWNPIKICLASLCGFIAYASIVPAVFWGVSYRLFH